MARTVARQPRRRLSWPADAPHVGIHLGVTHGLLKAARRARTIGAGALQIFSDNPTAWRRRAEPPRDAPAFVEYAAREGIGPVVIHASYLINLAGTSQPFAAQSQEGLVHEMQRAPQWGASIVNTHIGSHRGMGHAAGLARIVANVEAVLDASPPGVTLALENSAGGGDNLGSKIEELAEILDGVRIGQERLAFCLDTAHLWGAGYDISTAEGADAVVSRFAELLGLERLALIHLNDSRSLLGSRTDRHEHLGAGSIGPPGLGALLRDARLRQTTFVMETPGVDEGYDAVNMRRARLLYGGAMELPILPPKAFKLNRRSVRGQAPSRAVGG
ncbi:MAG TPA: deoxyribonuclease IV [Candidatus Limnocylindria bacterium]|nr:deoxyribonuclease IV [Candidatus Limnocylindria bacterium]